MRKNWIWGLSLLLIGGMASCKSSQSAYKAAYENYTRGDNPFDDNNDDNNDDNEYGSYSGTE